MKNTTVPVNPLWTCFDDNMDTCMWSESLDDTTLTRELSISASALSDVLKCLCEGVTHALLTRNSLKYQDVIHIRRKWKFSVEYYFKSWPDGNQFCCEFHWKWFSTCCFFQWRCCSWGSSARHPWMCQSSTARAPGSTESIPWNTTFIIYKIMRNNTWVKHCTMLNNQVTHIIINTLYGFIIALGNNLIKLNH